MFVFYVVVSKNWARLATAILFDRIKDEGFDVKRGVKQPTPNFRSVVLLRSMATMSWKGEPLVKKQSKSRGQG